MGGWRGYCRPSLWYSVLRSGASGAGATLARVEKHAQALPIQLLRPLRCSRSGFDSLGLVIISSMELRGRGENRSGVDDVL